MTDSADAITKGATGMKADLQSEQQRLEAGSDEAVLRTERMIVMLAAGGFLLGAVLAVLLGKQISRPMTAMCQAMRELANGHFNVVLPGLGRKDELGEMAGAVEEFKLQAVAKAERDAAAQDAQNKASSASRRAELIRFVAFPSCGDPADHRSRRSLRYGRGCVIAGGRTRDSPQVRFLH
jgi:HAMP domain-containing protein